MCGFADRTNMTQSGSHPSYHSDRSRSVWNPISVIIHRLAPGRRSAAKRFIWPRLGRGQGAERGALTVICSGKREGHSNCRRCPEPSIFDQSRGPKGGARDCRVAVLTARHSRGPIPPRRVPSLTRPRIGYCGRRNYGSPLAWNWSEYSPACLACCQKFLPNCYLPTNQLRKARS